MPIAPILRKTIPFALLLILLPTSALGRNPLSFEERVKAQEAIERVYYAHRFWPKENPGPKPPFEEMVPRSVIEAKVTDIIKKCNALEKFWQRPIDPAQLQAEMDRMAKGTKDPAMLKELYAALNDDPYLIAECLARPVLANRLFENWYAYDERFHGGVKAQAEEAFVRVQRGEALDSLTEGTYRKVQYTFRQDNRKDPTVSEDPNTIDLGSIAEFGRIVESIGGVGAPARLEETRDAFVVKRVIEAFPDRAVIEERFYSKTNLMEWWNEQAQALNGAEIAALLPVVYTLPSSREEFACTEGWRDSILDVPVPRSGHVAVWTGTEMIVFGGSAVSGCQSGNRYNPSTDTWTSMANAPGCYGSSAIWTGTEMILWGLSTNAGARYNPSTDTWKPTSTGANCPIAGGYRSLVWTGTEMIVWGSPGSYTWGSGGRYNPSNDTWLPTAVGGSCPTTRSGHSAIWNGSAMLIWGGYDGTFLNDGGAYYPASDSWVPIPIGTNSPTGRVVHSAVWTGTEMVIWGGAIGSTGGDYVNTGGRYNPVSNTWRPTSTGPYCPSADSACWGAKPAIWTGTRMIIWGPDSTGGLYDPLTDTWLGTSTGVNCPTGRSNPSAIWTGTEMIIWGGTGPVNSGGRYNPTSDTWVPTSTGGNCPSARSFHTAIWTGAEMIAWGGFGPSYFNNTGGRYTLATDTWQSTSTGSSCPSARWYHTAIWTGTEMIIWGGHDGALPLGSGGRYNPSANTWQPTNAGSSCPTPRYYHSGVWTGTHLVVWGGNDGTTGLNTGGKYDPYIDTWQSTSTGANCPSSRVLQSAVWTGRKMIVWGGDRTSPYFHLNDGGQYDPVTNTWQTIYSGPGGRSRHAAVWSGNEMIIWGGVLNDQPYYTNTGGRYNPVTDAWVATNRGGYCPWARENATAVWTGSEMLLWGGHWNDGTDHLENTGGRYRPGTDTWGSMSTGTGCPIGRDQHTAVWTGDKMVLWGGEYSNYLNPSNNGGVYSPGYLIPVVSGESESCQGDPVVLSTGSYAAYQWAKNSADIGGATLQTYAATANGSYAVRVTDTYGCSGTSDSKTVTFYSLPQPTVTGSATGCKSQGSVLTTQLFSGYQWYADGTALPGATERTVAATSSGTYTVSVTDSHGCTNTSPGLTVTLYDAPIPTIFGSSQGCSNPGATLTTQAFASYQWVRDGSVISGATSQSYNATTIGTHSYTVRVTDGNGCQGTSSGFSVTITASPTPTITGPNPACNSGLLSTQAYSAYQWFQDGSTITGATLQFYNAKAPGSYTVQVNDTNGCTGLSSAFVMNDCPCTVACTASAPATGYVAATISFQATGSPGTYCSEGATFSWDFGDGQGSTQQNPSHAYAAVGIYTWRMTATVQGATCIKTGTITISSPCSISCTATVPSSGYANTVISMQATATSSNCAGSMTFAWDFGDSQTSNQQNPSHIYISSGSFTWMMTASLEGFTCVKSETITISPCLCAADVNCDHAVNIVDMIKVQRVILGLDSQDICPRCDVNQDGSVNILDMIKIQRVILGLDTCP